MSFKKIIVVTLVAIAVIAIYLDQSGREEAAIFLIPLMLVIWGVTGVVEYMQGQAIQVTWYRVEPSATKGERLLHLSLACLLIITGLGVLTKSVV